MEMHLSELSESEWRSVGERFRSFLEPVCAVMGRSERRASAAWYIKGLLSPGERKSIEPLAKRLGVDGQRLQQFVADSPWEDREVWKAIRGQVLPHFGTMESWIVDETGWIKQGEHSVGVSHQYCGSVGKSANCQVCVEIVVSNGEIAAPAAGQLFLPTKWINDPERCRRAGVPDKTQAQTKPKIALGLLQQMIKDGMVGAPVLGDSLYGDSSEFRAGLHELSLEFFLQITPTGCKGWMEPPRLIKKKTLSYPAPDQPQGQTPLEMLSSFSQNDWQPCSWKAANGETRQTRLAWKKVWLGHGLRHKDGALEELWLIVDWPQGQAQPYHFYLAHLNHPPSVAICLTLSRSRWHVEQYFQRAKTDLGLDHYEGRSWTGFHHHLVLSALAYLFVLSQYLRSKKNFWPDVGSPLASDHPLATAITDLLPFLPNKI